jgi:hypothetical protein
MKKFNSSKSKKLTLKNLTAKFRKSLKNQTLKKLQSSRDDKETNIEMNDKPYHVSSIIKYLHSCARFLVENSVSTIQMSNLSIKSMKSITNRDLTRIFCDVVKNTAENKIWKREHRYGRLSSGLVFQVDYIAWDSSTIRTPHIQWGDNNSQKKNGVNRRMIAHSSLNPEKEQKMQSRISLNKTFLSAANSNLYFSTPQLFITRLRSHFGRIKNFSNSFRHDFKLFCFALEKLIRHFSGRLRKQRAR